MKMNRKNAWRGNSKDLRLLGICLKPLQKNIQIELLM